MCSNNSTFGPSKQYSIFLINFDAIYKMSIVVFEKLLLNNYYCITLVFHENATILEYKAILRMLKKSFDWNGLEVSEIVYRLYWIYFWVIEGVISDYLVVFIKRIKLMPIWAIITFEKVAIFLIYCKHCSKTIRIHYFYGFTENNAEMVS